MTSDAKIGLLLGLVFIFVIAFVINGLPRFRSTTSGSELTTNMVSSQNDSLGIGDRERKAQSLIDWPQQTAGRRPEPVQQTSETDEDVRYQRELSEIIPYTPIMEIPEQPEPAPGRPVETASAESIQPAVTRPVEPSAPQPATQDKIEIKKPTPATPVSPKVYTTCDGDNLTVIAKKFYGPEEGNRIANILRIFELNRGLLASPDEVKIGQKLIIPPPVASQTDHNRTGGTLSGALFEKVESIGRKLVQADSPKPTPSRPKVSADGKQYVVREGDSLWQIAVEQLGDGSRYKEIAKLNADVVKDEDNLAIGTTLKMPAR